MQKAENYESQEYRLRLRALPQPEPVGGSEAYNRERELALAFSERRRANYEKYLRSKRREANVEYLPIKLDIENVSRCNFHCTMCVVSDWPHRRRGDDMVLDDFKRLIDEQYGLLEIKLQGIGEPTLQGEVYFEMIKYARAQNIWVRTTTNASLLLLNDNYKKLIDSGVNEVQISVDGADKETFEAIRRGSRFERVMANCKLINDYGREKGIFRTKMWTVVQTRNVHQLEELVNLAAELGFIYQVFSLNLISWGMDDWREKNRAVSQENGLYLDRLCELAEQGKRKGTEVRFWNVTEKYGSPYNNTMCAWPFERAVVTSDLRTVPCCTIGNPDAFELGKGKSFSEVWKSEEYVQFRQAHLDGRIPKICQDCYYMEEHHGAQNVSQTK